MENDRWNRIRGLFRQASDLPQEEWERFLLAECPDDAEVRMEVLAMLARFEEEDADVDLPSAARSDGPARDDAEALTGTRIGPYAIQRTIARGGMGVVYEAIDMHLQKRVALKTMHPELANQPTYRRRFEQEARTLARLEDPHFVQVYSLFEDDARTFIVMEYVSGITLAEHLREKGSMPPEQLIPLARQLLTALSRAHDQGIIHRDLKPSNLMLSRDASGRPLIKILDFGISKDANRDANVTQTQGAIGTLYYMTPEQIRGLSDVDHRVDVYGVGVIMYEALTGRLPYDSNTDEFGIREAIVKGQLDPLDRVVASLPKSLTSVVMKALSADPSERYPSAEAMLHALEAVAFRPRVRPQVQDRSFLRMSAIAAALLLLVSAGLVIAYWPFGPTGVEDAGIVEAMPEQSIPLPVEATPAQPEDSVSINPVRSGDEPTLDDPAQRTEQVANPPADIQQSEQTQHANTEVVTDPPAIIPEDSLDTASDTSSVEAEPTSPPPPPLRTLTLRVNPPMQLKINDTIERDGVTSETVTLEEGVHEVRLSHPEQGQWACNVGVYGDEGAQIEVDMLQPLLVTIVARDQGSARTITGAVITIDDEVIADPTPQTVRLFPGLHQIHVSGGGFEQQSLQIDQPEGCLQTFGNFVNLAPRLDGRQIRIEAQMQASGN